MPDSEFFDHDSPAGQNCNICGIEEALIFIKVIQDEKVEEKGLCASCAIKYMENKDQLKNIHMVDQKVMDALDEMRSLLTAIVSNINIISTAMNSKSNHELKCGNCGLTYDNFISSGYLGCPYCYSAFQKELKDFLFEIERGGKHCGRMPKKFAKLFLLRKEIQFLKSQLKKFVHTENYEQAGKIKKKLERLIGSYPVGQDDEIY